MSIPIHAESNITPWNVLAQYSPNQSVVPEQIKQLEKKTIVLAGFIVPIIVDDSYENVEEFILVPDPLSCIHVPPPSANQMVYVKMKEPIPIDIDYLGVEVSGFLSFPKTKTDFGELFYLLDGISAKESNIEVEEYDIDYEDNYDEYDDDYYEFE